MAAEPDFVVMARAWLVRVQGHSRPNDEQRLAEELRKVYELGMLDGAAQACAVDPRTDMLTKMFRG